MIYCLKCGNTIKDNDLFCRKCGAKRNCNCESFAMEAEETESKFTEKEGIIERCKRFLIENSNWLEEKK